MSQWLLQTRALAVQVHFITVITIYINAIFSGDVNVTATDAMNIVNEIHAYTLYVAKGQYIIIAAARNAENNISSINTRIQ